VRRRSYGFLLSTNPLRRYARRKAATPTRAQVAICSAPICRVWPFAAVAVVVAMVVTEAVVVVLIEVLVETLVDVDVVGVVTELIEVLVETLVEIILTVPEPALAT
jgi:hypothetical protein